MFGFPALDEGYPYNNRVPTQRRRQTDFSRSLSLRRRLPPDRDVRYIPRPADRGLSVNTSVNGRRRDYGAVSASLAGFDSLRMPAMSVVRLPQAIPKVGYSGDTVVSPATAKPSGADRRFFSPDPLSSPVTRYGTPARIGAASLAVHSQMRDAFRFYKALSVVPCVQRAVRREVMFALGKQGGHKTKRRRGPFSDLRC